MPGKLKKPKKLSLLARSNLPEPLDAAGPDRDLCQKCGLFEQTRAQFVPPHVPTGWTGELLLVSDQPNEDKKAARVMGELLEEAGYEATAQAYAVRCGGAEPNMTQVRCCRPFLVGVLQDLKPQAVLGTGAVAACALANDGRASVTSLRGRLVEVPASLPGQPDAGSV